MEDKIFEASDSVRGSAPLRYVQYATFDRPVDLALGGRLESVRVAYETYGELNEAKDNAVLVCHALSGDSHVARHDENDDPGWWDILIGPGKPVDTNRFYVICPNLLGGCRGTTGPNSLNPATGKAYGPDFPEITVADMVEVKRLLLDHLGVDQLLGVLGGSMGGMMAMHWARAYPDQIKAALVLASAPRLTSQALAFDIIGRNAIVHDPNFNGGHHYEDTPGADGYTFHPAKPIGGLAIARMIGHITYLSRESMKSKFDENRNSPPPVDSRFELDTSVASYLAYQGDKFVDRFDANSYLVLSRVIDNFDLGEGDALIESLRPSTCNWLLLSFTSDWLFPPEQSQRVVDALVAQNKPVSYCNIYSECGHDAFLLENEIDAYGEMVREFLERTCDPQIPVDETEESAELQSATNVDLPDEPQEEISEHSDTSIFHGRRLDYDLLEELLAAEGARPTSNVLDLGCGGGQMLLRLRRKGWKRLTGVEIGQSEVLSCIGRGIPCIHADLNDGLGRFGDKQFDFVLLSRTLQTIYNVKRVVTDMLRVGRRCIVSFPNFGFRPLRRMLAERGLAPEAAMLKDRWYNTPNIRFFTIDDFLAYCARRNIKIHQSVALNTEARERVVDNPNLNADLAVFVISQE